MKYMIKLVSENPSLTISVFPEYNPTEFKTDEEAIEWAEDYLQKLIDSLSCKVTRMEEIENAS